MAAGLSGSESYRSIVGRNGGKRCPTEERGTIGAKVNSSGKNDQRRMVHAFFGHLHDMTARRASRSSTLGP